MRYGSKTIMVPPITAMCQCFFSQLESAAAKMANIRMSYAA